MEEKPLSKFQEACGDALRNNKSVLLVAPTGTGKTIAAVEPFADSRGNMLLGTRIMYTLPMRALASGVKSDLDERLCVHDLSVCNLKHHRCAMIHHGQKPDSQTFIERAIITTIDQYLTAFAGTPLSFTSKSGHAAAGAILASYSVFDEVHLLDARAGLPLLFAMLQQRQRWGLLSCVMTATLPESVIAHFEKNLDLTVLRVEAGSEDAKKRDDCRRVTVEYAVGLVPELRAEAILKEWREQGANGRVLVFCNTVPTARKLYDSLREQAGAENVLLAHSRFTSTDRQKIDHDVSARFGEQGSGGILITTQVSEAGLNISAPVVFSELAPADSLIQRAGRCARFFRKATPEQPLQGRFIVLPLAISGKSLAEGDCLPYNLEVVLSTQTALTEDLDSKVLDWEREQQFVNRSLSDFYAAFVSDQDFTAKERDDRRKSGRPLSDKQAVPLTSVSALGAFETAFQSSDASVVEKLLRDSITVSVGVVNDFEAARTAYNSPKERDKHGNPMPRLPETISLRLSSFAGLRKQNAWQVREVQIQHKARRPNSDAEKRADVEPLQLSHVQRLRPNATYWLLASEANYRPETGLGIEPGAGAPTEIAKLKSYDRGQRQQEGRRQSWRDHATGAHKESNRILKEYRPFLEAWAEKALGQHDQTAKERADALQDVMELAVLLHDVGKLNDDWQQKVGRNAADDGPIARTTYAERDELRKNGVSPPPYHAQYVFALLKSLLCAELKAQSGGEVVSGYRLYEHIALAAARHHSLTLDGDINTAANADEHFRWTEGGREAVRAVVREILGDNAPASLFPGAGEPDLLNCLEQECKAGEAPGPSADDYFIYCLTNRLTIFSDICDAGAGELELLPAPAAPDATEGR